MVTKTRSYYSGALSGVMRPSHFHEFGSYTIAGVPSTESITGNLNYRIGAGWSGGSSMFLSRDKVTYAPDPLRAIWRTFEPDGAVLGDGTIRLMYPAGAYPPSLGVPNHPSKAARIADGATGFARTEPTNPAFDLSVFLGELRNEGLPNLPGAQLRERTRLAKASGGEYLNVEFGWLPLVNGVRDFANTVNNSDKITRDYQERANRVTKRRYVWPSETSSQAFPARFSMEPAVGFFEGGGYSEHRFEHKWYEASYIYYLPTGSSRNDKIRRYGSYARKLLGVDLSPEVLWNLSPWSWAADWFSNTGDVMHNLSALGTDGLLMRYGHVMHHTGLESVSSGSFNGDPRYYQVKTVLNETKSREGANPFGWGVNDGDLSPRQLAILAALGMSRIPG